MFSLRDIPPPKWPHGMLTLPARSLTVISYQMKQPTDQAHIFSGDRSPKSSPTKSISPSSHLQQSHLLSYVTVQSSDPSSIMLPIPPTASSKQSFNVSVPFKVPSSLGKARRALLRFGVLGVSGNGTWEVNLTCSSGSSHVSVSMYCCGSFTAHVNTMPLHAFCTQPSVSVCGL